MEILLDTHSLLWFYEGSPQLSKNIKEIVLDFSNVCYLSIASLWEITIKFHLGKLSLDNGLKDLFDFVERNQIIILSIELDHLIILTELEDHHRDPFDRIIIAQAQSEQIAIATQDGLFKAYSIKTIW